MPEDVWIAVSDISKISVRTAMHLKKILDEDKNILLDILLIAPQIIPITLNKLANISPFSIASFSNLIPFFNKDIPSMYAGINYVINSFKNPIL